MMKVQAVADSYGVSAAFMVRALAQVGFENAEADTLVPSVILTRFEAEFGAAIQAKKPAKPIENPFSTFRSERKPRAQVVRIAHDRVGAGRDSMGNREKRLLSDPGLVHAIDLTGTWDGDRWKGEVVPGAVHFFGGPINSGPRAACGRGQMRAVLGDEFVPADEPAKSGQCPKCAELVAEGKAFRDPPGYYGPFCHAYLHVKINGGVEVQNCNLSGQHRGVHRTRDGATWSIGFDDFVPAPLDAGCRITKVS